MLTTAKKTTEELNGRVSLDTRILKLGARIKNKIKYNFKPSKYERIAVNGLSIALGDFVELKNGLTMFVVEIESKYSLKGVIECKKNDKFELYEQYDFTNKDIAWKYLDIGEQQNLCKAIVSLEDENKLLKEKLAKFESKELVQSMKNIFASCENIDKMLSKSKRKVS